MICSTPPSARERCLPPSPLTAPSHYYEGLLAAVRPHGQRVFVPPPSELPPLEIPPSVSSGNLSWEELVKRRLHPLDSFVRLLDCAAENRPPEADDRFRFQWFGLFYQAPERDAFTLRLRLPGGRVKPWQLVGLADLTQRHASGHVLCNDQGGLDVPGVPITSAIDALIHAEGIGFNPRRTGGDCVQAVRGGELDGLTDHTPFYPLVCALEQACSLSPALSDLPLPCEIVFAREHEHVGMQPQFAIDTIILRLSAHAGRNPEEGHAANSRPAFIFCLPGDPHGFRLARRHVVPACVELLKSWAAGADRSSRNAASLCKFAAGTDLDALKVLPGGAQHERLPSVPEPSVSPDHDETPNGHPIPEGGLLSGQLIMLDQCCRTHGWSEIRLLHGQLYVVGSRGEIVDATSGLSSALSV